MDKIRVIEVEICEDFDTRVIERMIGIEERKARRFVILFCMAMAFACVAMLATDLRSLAFLFVLMVSCAMIGKRL